MKFKAILQSYEAIFLNCCSLHLFLTMLKKKSLYQYNYKICIQTTYVK